MVTRGVRHVMAELLGLNHECASAHHGAQETFLVTQMPDGRADGVPGDVELLAHVGLAGYPSLRRVLARLDARSDHGRDLEIDRLWPQKVHVHPSTVDVPRRRSLLHFVVRQVPTGTYRRGRDRPLLAPPQSVDAAIGPGARGRRIHSPYGRPPPRVRGGLRGGGRTVPHTAPHQTAEPIDAVRPPGMGAPGLRTVHPRAAYARGRRAADIPGERAGRAAPNAAAESTPEGSAAVRRDPLTFYTWDVELLAPTCAGEGGVTDNRSLAFGHVHRALQGQPAGAHGQVRRVALSPRNYARYVELAVIGRAWQTGDGVAWSEGGE